MTPTWQLFIYRLPPNPSRTRVAVWRELRRFGALPLQQSVVAVPEIGDLIERLDGVERRIADEGGVSYRFRLGELEPAQQERLRIEWNRVRDQEYAEIVEECRTKFKDEVEFELFRKNLTGSEAEEIEADLEKIRSWFERVRQRDHFTAAGRVEAELAIEESQILLDDFVEKVFEAEALSGGISLDPPGSPIDPRALIESALGEPSEREE